MFDVISKCKTILKIDTVFYKRSGAEKLIKYPKIIADVKSELALIEIVIKDIQNDILLRACAN